MKKSRRQNCLLYKGIKMYSLVPKEIKNAPRLSIFKDKCRKYVCNKY